MTTPLETLEDLLASQGLDTGGEHACDCGSSNPAFAMVRKLGEDGDALDEFQCSSCHISAVQKARTEAEEAAKAARIAADPWDSEEGNTVRAQRVAMIERFKWAVDRDTSPLTDACQDEFRAMIRALHRLTVDYPCPTSVEWPTVPPYVYAD